MAKLEQRTGVEHGATSFVEQRDHGLPHPSRVNNRGVRVGAQLGLLNTLFIAFAFGFAFAKSEETQLSPWFLALMIFAFGVVPGVVTGMLLGRIGIALARRHVVIRCIALAVPAIGTMLGYAAFFGLASRFALGVIPTVVCALILERATRARSDLPTATVQ